MFCTIIDWFMNKGFGGPVKSIGQNMVDATIDVYNSISENLLPTPAKSHYTFNLRDISKVIQGVTGIKPDHCKDKEGLARLWSHEVYRVFYDRLVNDEDRSWFVGMLAEKNKEFYNIEWNKIMGKNDNLIYGNFIDNKAVVKPYVEINDREKLQKVMDE